MAPVARQHGLRAPARLPEPVRLRWEGGHRPQHARQRDQQNGGKQAAKGMDSPRETEGDDPFLALQQTDNHRSQKGRG